MKSAFLYLVRTRGKIASSLLCIIASLLLFSCGRSQGHALATSAGSKVAAERTSPYIQTVLSQIDAYPVPNGVSAQTWTMLVTELKKQLVARSKDGKTLNVEPTGTLCKVTDLAAASNLAATQATVTWTEVLPGDCNNDG